MLKRLYVDNYNCLVNFELRPGPLHLLMGANGTGKSTLGMLLTSLRDVVAGDTIVPDSPKVAHFGATTFNKWQKNPLQTIELEVRIEEHSYVYKFQVEHEDPARSSETLKPRILSESLDMDGQRLLEFVEGKLSITKNNRAAATLDFRLDWHRSALTFLQARADNTDIFRFKRWVEDIGYFRLVPPFPASAGQESVRPDRTLSNFSGWWRYMLQEDPGFYGPVEQTLREVLAGFRTLRFRTLDDGRKAQIAEFHAGGQEQGFLLDSLSDGQQVLIALYSLLHGYVNSGRLVIFDEPDNFVALREIQPWLNQLQERTEESKAQVMIISHHPEMLNQLAPEYGLVFRRLDSGYVNVEPYQPQEPGGLTPAELEARGW